MTILYVESYWYGATSVDGISVCFSGLFLTAIRYYSYFYNMNM